jgi:hypothetical protein
MRAFLRPRFGQHRASFNRLLFAMFHIVGGRLVARIARLRNATPANC